VHQALGFLHLSGVPWVLYVTRPPGAARDHAAPTGRLTLLSDSCFPSAVHRGCFRCHDIRSSSLTGARFLFASQGMFLFFVPATRQPLRDRYTAPNAYPPAGPLVVATDPADVCAVCKQVVRLTDLSTMFKLACKLAACNGPTRK
jgi:hypothetical protein